MTRIRLARDAGALEAQVGVWQEFLRGAADSPFASNATAEMGKLKDKLKERLGKDYETEVAAAEKSRKDKDYLTALLAAGRARKQLASAQQWGFAIVEDDGKALDALEETLRAEEKAHRQEQSYAAASRAADARKRMAGLKKARDDYIGSSSFSALSALAVRRVKYEPQRRKGHRGRLCRGNRMRLDDPAILHGHEAGSTPGAAWTLTEAHGSSKASRGRDALSCLSRRRTGCTGLFGSGWGRSYGGCEVRVAGIWPMDCRLIPFT